MTVHERREDEMRPRRVWQYRPVCACGWKGEYTGSADANDAQWDEHRDDVGAPIERRIPPAVIR